MALRMSTSRRILAGVLAPTALGVAAAAAILLPQQKSPTVADPALAGMASTAECHDLVSLGIGGRNDIPRDQSKMLVDEKGNVLPAAQQGAYSSHWVDPVINAPLEGYGDRYAAIYIEYPADLASYEAAVNTGAANTIAVMQAIKKSCPDTQFAIVGYSQGADVARRAAMQIGAQEAGDDETWPLVDPESVRGVVILSDAGRREGEGFFPGAQNPNNPDGFDRPYEPGHGVSPGRGVLPNTSGDFGKLAGRVASFCSEGDFTCSAPENIALIELLANVGRQINADALEREGLTPATGADLAQVVGRVALLALDHISADPDWMRSDETFLEVLIKVSDPNYDPATARPATPVADEIEVDVEDGTATPIPSDRLANLAYLPDKIVKEIVGFIRSNQNTLAVVLSDPYDQTFGYNAELDDHYGHHFDYWDRPEGGTSTVDYAAAWLVHLAQQAKEGKQVTPKDADKAAVLAILAHPELLEPDTDEDAPAAAVGTTTDEGTPQAPVVDPAVPAGGEQAAAPEVTGTAPEVTPTTPVDAETSAEPPQTESTTPTTGDGTTDTAGTEGATTTGSTPTGTPVTSTTPVPTSTPAA